MASTSSTSGTSSCPHPPRPCGRSRRTRARAPGFAGARVGNRAPHLLDPGRLEASARRLYGDAFDVLWGPLAPVPAENVNVVGDSSSASSVSRPGTPGITSRISTEPGRSTPATLQGFDDGSRFVVPPCPPPDIDLEAWEDTIAEIERRAPARLALIHFGVVDDVVDHLAALRETLERWGKRVADGMDEQAFVAAARYDVSETDPELVDEFERAGPYWHHFRGIERYWRQRREGM